MVWALPLPTPLTVFVPIVFPHTTVRFESEYSWKLAVTVPFDRRRVATVEPLTLPASRPKEYGVEFEQVTVRLVAWLMAAVNTPLLPKASGLVEIAQSLLMVRLTKKVAVLVVVAFAGAIRAATLK